MAIYPAVGCLIFLILYVTSSYLNTVNVLNSVAYLALFTSYVFVFFVSAGITMKKRVLLVSIVVFTLGAIALYVSHLLNIVPLRFLSHQDFQFILPTESGHNHLGDLAGLGLISSLFLAHSPLVLGVQLLFLVVISLSFSKSALLGLVITVFVLMLNKRGYRALFVGLALISLLIIAVYSRERIPLQPLDTAQKTLQKVFHITPKPLLSSREKYVAQILKPWASTPLEHLFFGYGPGNFKYASSRTARSMWDVVSDTHNILLMLFVESGFLPAAWFVIFVGTVLLIAHKRQNSLLYPVLYLFIHFQMDYTYRIPFFMYLFFFMAGQIAHTLPTPPASLPRKIIFLLVSLSFLVFFNILNNKVSTEYKATYIQLNKGIETQNKRLFMSAAEKLEQMTPYESDLLLTLASFHESFGNIDESIRLLDKLYVYAPRDYFANLPHLMALKRKMRSDTRTYLRNKEVEFKLFPFTEKEKSELDHICREYLERECL